MVDQSGCDSACAGTYRVDRCIDHTAHATCHYLSRPPAPQQVGQAARKPTQYVRGDATIDLLTRPQVSINDLACCREATHPYSFPATHQTSDTGEGIRYSKPEEDVILLSVTHS